jgi:hypothetical protein
MSPLRSQFRPNETVKRDYFDHLKRISRIRNCFTADTQESKGRVHNASISIFIASCSRWRLRIKCSPAEGKLSLM